MTNGQDHIINAVIMATGEVPKLTNMAQQFQKMRTNKLSGTGYKSPKRTNSQMFLHQFILRFTQAYPSNLAISL